LPSNLAYHELERIANETVPLDSRTIVANVRTTIIYDQALARQLDARHSPENAATMRIYAMEAERLRAAGRLDDAAAEYERLGLLEEAGRLREQARTQIVKNINVDVNQLLDQVRREGLVLAYKCPSCGGRLKISGDTGASSLRVCSHCGNTLDVKSIEDFLKHTFG